MLKYKIPQIVTLTHSSRMGNKRIEVVLFIVYRLTDTKPHKFLIQYFYLLPDICSHEQRA